MAAQAVAGAERVVVAGHLDTVPIADNLPTRLLDDDGELRRFVNVYVGNEDVRFLDDLATETADGAQVSIIPAVAGGC